MAITRLSTITTKAIASGGSSNWNGSHTTDASTDCLFVIVFWSGATTTTISTISWNGVSLAPTLGTANQSGADKVQLYCLVAPTIQTGTLTVTPSANARGGWVAVNYSGVNQTTPTGTIATNTSSSNNTSPTVTVTSAVGEIVIAGLASNNGDTTTITAGQTSLANFIGAAGDGTTSGRFLVEEASGAASVAMNGTLSTARAWAAAGISIKPATASYPTFTEDLLRVEV